MSDNKMMMNMTRQAYIESLMRTRSDLLKKIMRVDLENKDQVKLNLKNIEREIQHQLNLNCECNKKPAAPKPKVGSVEYTDVRVTDHSYARIRRINIDDLSLVIAADLCDAMGVTEEDAFKIVGESFKLYNMMGEETNDVEFVGVEMKDVSRFLNEVFVHYAKQDGNSPVPRFVCLRAAALRIGLLHSPVTKWHVAK